MTCSVIRSTRGGHTNTVSNESQSRECGWLEVVALCVVLNVATTTLQRNPLIDCGVQAVCIYEESPILDSALDVMN